MNSKQRFGHGSVFWFSRWLVVSLISMKSRSPRGKHNKQSLNILYQEKPPKQNQENLLIAMKMKMGRRYHGLEYPWHNEEPYEQHLSEVSLEHSRIDQDCEHNKCMQPRKPTSSLMSQAYFSQQIAISLLLRAISCPRKYFKLPSSLSFKFLVEDNLKVSNSKLIIRSNHNVINI